jgi:hypothetical protein
VPEKPPVPSGRQEELNNQARVLMSKLSTDLNQARASLVTPPKFTPATVFDDKQEIHPQTFTPPVIPPIIPNNAEAPHSSSSWATAHPAPGGPVHPTEPSAPSPVNSVRQPGLVLGGVHAPVLPPAPPPTIPTPPPIGGPLPPVITQPPILPPATSFGPGPPHPGAIRSVPGEGFVRGGPGTGVRPLPPGGIIGTTPVGGIAPSPMSRGVAQRVNPVGGVIGNTAPAGSRGPATATSGQLSSANRATGRRKGDNAAKTWDPDNPWETEEGVAPVVVPAAERRFDPGPVIGL